MTRPSRSLQARLLGLVLGLVTLVWLSAAVLTWYDAQHELDELLDGHLAQTASLLIAHQSTTAHAPPDDRARPQDRDDDEEGDDQPDDPPLHKYAPQVAFQVFHEGVLVNRSAHVGNTPISARRDGFETLRRSDGALWRVFATHGHERDVQVLVAERTTMRDDILWAVLGSVLKPLIFALPLLVLALWWAVRRGLMPLRLLGQAIGKRQPHTTEPVGLSDTPLEVQSLVQALNDLFERITRMMELERRFTADAAHELRTPIAAIRAQVQVAMGAGDNERAHALRNTLAGCDRATRLVEQLLTLARLEAAPAAHSASLGACRTLGVDSENRPQRGQFLPDLQAHSPAMGQKDGEKWTAAVDLQPTIPKPDRLLDLAALTRQIAASVAPAALARQQTLELQAPTPVGMRGNETLVGVLVRNLLDNALRYSPSGATIQASVSATPQGVQLRVQDSGPGLTEEQMSHLGERFFRVLGSDQPGSGLGWSIVRRIAHVHGAQIHVTRSSLLGGLDVTVHWPHLLTAA